MKYFGTFEIDFVILNYSTKHDHCQPAYYEYTVFQTRR